MINLSSTNLSPLNLGGMNTSEIKLGYPSSGCPISGLKGLQGLYMGKGLTNEMMSRDPVWRDKSGNGNHIALKNFAWAEKSGVGMYANDLARWVSNNGSVFGIKKTSSKIECTNINFSGSLGVFARTSASLWNNVEVNVKAGDKGLIFYSISVSHGNEVVAKIEPNGTGKIKISDEMFSRAFLVGCGPVKNVYKGDSFSWEILPYAYENALCFDGVDDYGICETFPIFTKEKGYTVMALRKWISREPQFVNLVTNTASWGVDGAFSLEYKNGQAVLLNSAVNFGSANGVDLPYGALTYQTSESYNGVAIKKGERIGTNTVLLGRSAVSGFQFYSSFALYALAIIDHDTTAEERQLVIDYWKKEFPELFPDQAWTVTGKTNSDDDRATIKNITGNGNDLVLTNFGFKGNSGYGLYNQDFSQIATNNYAVGTISNSSYKSTTWIAATDIKVGNFPTYWKNGTYANKRFGVILSSNLPDFKIALRWADNEWVDLKIQELHLGFNLVDTLPDEDFNSMKSIFPYTKAIMTMSPGDWFTLEQVPDYEGYLVTDGVDDGIISSQKFALSKDYTVVGDWKLLVDETKACGVVRVNQFYIYNHTSGIQLYINTTSGGVVLKNIKSLKAVCSNGKVYDEDWNEIIIKTGDLITDSNKFYLGYLGSNYTQLAFKNLAIYNNTILTKDQCIRAYNYLQTIKNN